jgi:hypothetical protein
MLGNAVAPGLLDHYLARTGFEAQQTDQKHSADAAANLWDPADQEQDFGAHGIFDDRAQRTSIQLWASQHHTLLASAASVAGLVSTAALSRLLRRN